MTVRRIGARPNVLGQITQVVAYGNSIVANSPFVDRDRDVMTRFAQMIGAREFNYAKNAARMSWHNDITANHYGVVPAIFQNHARPNRAASTLNAATAAGASSLTLSAVSMGPPLKQYDVIHVGDSERSASTRGEIITVASVSGSTVTFSNAESNTNSTSMIRAHAAGQKVMVVPTQYAAGNTIYLLCESHNHLAQYGLGAASERWYKDNLRASIARLRCAEVYETLHPAHVANASWAVPTDSPGAGSGRGTTSAAGGGGVRRATAAGATMRFEIPANWDGGTALMQFEGLAMTSNSIIDFTVDGVAAGSMTIQAGPTAPANMVTYHTMRFKNLAAGPHVILATVSTLGSNGANGGIFHDFSGLEAKQPPIVVVFKAHRMARYHGIYTAGLPYGAVPTRLASQANAGAGSISVDDAQAFNTRGIGTASPTAGETITISPGTALEETKTVATVTGIAAPWLITFSVGQTLANTHPVASPVDVGIKDSDLPTINGWIDSVCDEFDDWVVRYNPDIVIKKDPAAFAPMDGGHFSEIGHALAAQGLYDLLAKEDRLNSAVTSKLARPAAPIPGTVNFLHDGVAVVWTNMPAALSEFPLTTAGPSNYRRPADLARAYEARLVAIQTVIGAANAKLGVQYLADDGVTWRYLHRRLRAGETDPMATDFYEPAAATDNSAWLSIGTALPAGGLRTGLWFPLPYDAIRADVILRLVGLGGDGVLDPALMTIYLEYR